VLVPEPEWHNSSCDFTTEQINALVAADARELRRKLMEATATQYPTVSDDPQVQAFYEMCREKGTDHNMAKIFALRDPPSLRTNKTFLANRGNPFEGDDAKAKRCVAAARAGGVNPTGKTYLGGLAKYEGDPKAWIDGKGDVERVCAERGWGCEGSVTVEEPVNETPDLFEEPYRVADDLVQEEVAKRLNGETVGTKERAELVEKVGDQLSGD